MSTSYQSGSYDDSQRIGTSNEFGMYGNGGGSTMNNGGSSYNEITGNVGGGSGHGSSSLYASCSRVPLIKSPAVRVPPPINLPSSGIHPLPPNLQEYFVYPFNLEKFVLDSADRREKARKEDLLRRAPGWNEDGKVLEPTKRPTSMNLEQHQHPKPQHTIDTDGDGIDEIAQMLDRLDKSTS